MTPGFCKESYEGVCKGVLCSCDLACQATLGEVIINDTTQRFSQA